MQSSEENSIITEVEQGVKRKQKPENNSKEKRTRKKSHKRSKTVADKQHKSAVSNISEDDRKLLDRWKDMQTKTKPFIHPIRKHMKEIEALREQHQKVEVHGGRLNDQVDKEEVRRTGVQYHFTNYVSDKEDGESLKAVKDAGVVDPGKCLATMNMFSQNVLGKFTRFQ